MTCFVTGRGGGERERKGRGPSKINVFAITWIWFIGFRQNLTWTYYLTLGTFFLKSKMAAGGQKFATRYTFFAITWIWFIGFRQNLEWTYYLTLGTSLRRNFSFFSKSKMTTGGQKSKIGQILPHKSHFLQ